MQCKCKDCQKRYVGCHSKCTDYIEYRKMIDKEREYLNKYKEKRGARTYERKWK